MLIKFRHDIKKQIKKLKKMLFECESKNDLRLWKRIKGILLFLNKKSPDEIVEILNVSQRSVYYWITHCNEFGVDGLLEREHTGRTPQLNQEQMLQLGDIIDSGPIAYGFESGIWTSKIIREVIKQEFGVIYHDGHVRKILHKLGFSVQDPRKKLVLADENLQQKWVRETYPTLKKTLEKKMES